LQMRTSSYILLTGNLQKNKPQWSPVSDVRPAIVHQGGLHGTGGVNP
jgi:hypothetical protein